MPVVWGADPGICAFGGAGTLAGALSLGKEALDPDNRPQLAKPAADTAVLALLVAATCPTAAERTIDRDEPNTKLWLASLKDDMESALPADSVPTALHSLAGSVNCTASTPGLCALQKRLPSLAGNGSPRAVGDVCLSTALFLTDGLTKDLMDADGAYVIDRTHDLATVLAICPDQFYAFMHSHQKELDFWLQQADRFLFWGDPPSKIALGKYRSELISAVEHSLQRNGFTDEKRQILAHFLRTGVTVTQ